MAAARLGGSLGATAAAGPGISCDCARAAPLAGRQGPSPRAAPWRLRAAPASSWQPLGGPAAGRVPLESIAAGAALGTLASTATLSATLRRRGAVARRGKCALGPYRKEAAAKSDAVFKSREKFDLTGRNVARVRLV
ncbi:unnamed protein product [Prorocentrum cordatum]|uniref:Uncharacterized protein n=1 Tax=Prorocentrum cordatum TaxID=2364126 RepID=A0ABN9TEV8_9DINO|nr:unnamed protein product [Polarella glacialis]